MSAIGNAGIAVIAGIAGNGIKADASDNRAKSDLSDVASRVSDCGRSRSRLYDAAMRIAGLNQFGFVRLAVGHLVDYGTRWATAPTSLTEEGEALLLGGKAKSDRSATIRRKTLLIRQDPPPCSPLEEDREPLPHQSRSAPHRFDLPGAQLDAKSFPEMHPLPIFRSPLALLALSALAALSAFGENSDSDRYLQAMAETQNFSLGRPTEAIPTADGKYVIFLRSDSPRDRTTGLYGFDVASGQTEQLASPEKLLREQTGSLSAEEKMRQERTRTKVTGITSFALSEDGDQIAFTLPGALFVYRLGAKSLVKLKTGAGNAIDPTFSPDGRKIAYVRNYNLFVYDFQQDREHAVTSGGTETKSFGMAEFVAQEEMARTKGFWWLPDSKTIVYQVNDSSKVEIWYVGDPSAPQNPPYPSHYPRPGKNNVDVRLAVVNADNAGNAAIAGNRIKPDASDSRAKSDLSDVASRVSDDGAKSDPAVWIEWDRDKYPYLVRVSPSKFGPLTITVETRDQHELALLETNPETGATRPLLTEDDPDWVNIDQSVPAWLP
ncbi:MAG: DPP IV N-terminal domain-containing protein, partial [Verrucomicrobia bacterium]|nr:DPP IV N-terminal domain-containing protein [Verrucomicrobiota bacterium]